MKVKLKTAELIGPALDAAVAIAHRDPFAPVEYSTQWRFGGPIIEQEEISIKRRAPCMQGEEWEAMGSITAKGAGYRHAVGPTPLIAAMRCYVASKLGDEVTLEYNEEV